MVVYPVEGAIWSVWGIHSPEKDSLLNGGAKEFIEFPNHLIVVLFQQYHQDPVPPFDPENMIP